jgi:biotin-(acetyl-CoA carboxylase) ligase
MVGTFRGIDAQGRMLLERADGKIDTIEAGDFSFAPPLPVR